jgi:hypothetical protein
MSAVERGMLFTSVYLTALVVVIVVLIVVMTRRGMSLRRQMVGVALLLGPGLGLFAWLLGLGAGLALLIGGVVIAIGPVVYVGGAAAIDAVNRVRADHRD